MIFLLVISNRNFAKLVKVEVAGVADLLGDKQIYILSFFFWLRVDSFKLLPSMLQCEFQIEGGD